MGSEAIRQTYKGNGFLLRHVLVGTLCDNIPGIKTMPKNDVLACKTHISIALRSAEDKKTGRVLQNAVPSVSSVIYSQMIVALGKPRVDELGISRSGIENILRQNGLVATESLDLELAKKTKDFHRALLQSNNVDEIWKLIPKSIIELGVAHAAGVYEISPERREMHMRARVGLVGFSRYEHQWRTPTGEKGYVPFVNDIVAEMCRRSEGKGKEYEDYRLLKIRTSFALIKRGNYEIFSINRKNVREALKASGADDISASIFASSEARELARTLVQTFMKRLCFSDKCIDERGRRIFTAYIAQFEKNYNGDRVKQEKIRTELGATYEAVIKRYKEAAQRAVKTLYSDKNRQAASRLSCQSHNMSDLHRLISGGIEGYMTPQEMFSEAARYFSEGQQDVYSDMERLNIEGDEVPNFLDLNFYYLTENGLVMANNHEASVNSKKPIMLFDGRKDVQAKYVAALMEISDVLSNTIQLKVQQSEADRERERSKKRAKLSDLLVNNHIDLVKRLEEAAKVLREILVTNGEDVRVSIGMDGLQDSDEITVVASTDKNALNERLKISGDPDRPSVWAMQQKKDVFVHKGRIFLGGELFDIENLKDNKPLYEKLRDIAKNQDETFMIVPLLSGTQEVIGVINVRGARLTQREMDNLRVVANTIGLAINSTLESDEIKRLRDEAQARAFSDQLTGIPNRRYLDEIFPGLFAAARGMAKPISLLFLDIDRLKWVDDIDHQAGDYLIISFAQWVNEFIKQKYGEKSGVQFVRFGGDEFMIIMPDTNIKDADNFANELVKFIASQRLKFTMGEFSNRPENKDGYGFSVSVGIAERTPEMKTHQNLISNADAALYWRKRNGKNGVCVYTEDVASEVAKIMAAEEGKKKERANATVEAEGFLKGFSMDEAVNNVENAISSLKTAVDLLRRII